MTETLRYAAALGLAAALTALFDRRSRRLGLDPPGFADPMRRVAGLTALGLGLAITAVLPLVSSGAAAPERDLTGTPIWALFANHLILVASGLGWYFAGYAGTGSGLADQLGLRARRPWNEVALGAAAGIASWVVAIGVALVVAQLMTRMGGGDLVPSRPPAAVAFIVALPIAVRLALGLSAGLFEELFFRGLLQPRLGLVTSTALFAAAHLSYGQPFLLLGVTVLSVFYGLLVRWRQSLWAAIAAHALFDLVQLLIVVPSLFRSFRGLWQG